MYKLSLTEIKHIFEEDTEDTTMLQISEIVKKTKEMFNLFNDHFYDNELIRPTITISPDSGRGAYGWTIKTLVPETEARNPRTAVSNMSAPAVHHYPGNTGGQYNLWELGRAERT